MDAPLVAASCFALDLGGKSFDLIVSDQVPRGGSVRGRRVKAWQGADGKSGLVCEVWLRHAQALNETGGILKCRNSIFNHNIIKK